MAPPGPASAGHAWGRGTHGARAATTGNAASVLASRAAKLPRPRWEAMRQAQASATRPGRTAATPKLCSSKSAAMAPAGPARLVGGRDVAVLIEGSSGL